MSRILEGATHIIGTFPDNIVQWSGLSQELQAPLD